jgi:hypothetical protein
MSELQVADYEKKKEYCCQNIKNLNLEEKIKIYQSIRNVDTNNEIDIVENQKGLFINLDKIKDKNIVENIIYPSILYFNQQLYKPLNE